MLLAAATTLPFVLNAGFGKAPVVRSSVLSNSRRTTVTASSITNCRRRDSPARSYTGCVIFSGHETRKRAPAAALPLVNTDLAGLPSGEDVMVWLGHSSWYLQLAGKRILIDPVFSDYAAPFSFINKAFPGDYPVERAADAGDRSADYLPITTTISTTPPLRR